MLLARECHAIQETGFQATLDDISSVNRLRSGMNTYAA